MKARAEIPLIGVAALLAAACSTGGPATTGAPSAAACGFAAKTPATVGYSVFDLKQPYWQLYAKGIQDEAKKLGWGYVQSDQKSSEQAQVQGSSDLINQGISALIVSPIQPDALPATITQAHQAKIPVVIGDVGAVGDYDAYVVSNNYDGGVQAAKYMMQALKDKPGTKEIAVIELDPGIVVGHERVAGFVDTLKTGPSFKIVSSLNGKNTPEGGFDVAKNQLSAHPNIAGIYTSNDPMGAGASKAIAAAGKAKEVTLVSFNGDPPALDQVLAGTMHATIAQDPYGQGTSAVDAASALLKCQAPTFTKADKKTIEVPVSVITKDNAQARKDDIATKTGSR